ncbi:MAG: hypothetical protein ACPG47_11795 [Leucothrix sp.]
MNDLLCKIQAILADTHMRRPCSRVDELLPLIQKELDDTKRQVMIDEVTATTQKEVAYIPMYVQPLIWASKDNISLTQRTDNFFILRWVTVK